ncbi:hypothetical protein RMSM_02833 [Rhodopirellula maiorica SM1]|uniref:FAD dependent oxidoreductase n=2 Tax=Novipirellula TaxID=2795426 RepID=M5RM14_9BACT|nr:hypothetical protein RMSM_02833 [Rhodopirellula maiorica SM1]
MLVGRCISVSHVAMGSIRVMNSLGAAAQSVGMAAAICNEKNVEPRQIAEDHIAELQQRLLRADVHLIRLPNQDHRDLARAAEITSSSDQPYQAEHSTGSLELKYDLAQQFPVTPGHIKSVGVRLQSERSDVCEIVASVYRSHTLGRFDEQTPVAEKTIKVDPNSSSWIDVKLNEDTTDPSLLWICLSAQPGVFWSYSGEEALGTRFAARFDGELVPRPSHGKARIAPVTDDWFPLNHHGRLPQELHDWMSETVGIEFDRKVRATLCHRVKYADAPTSLTSPYQATNVTNGISRAEDWPNIWISDRSQPLPQSVSLKWGDTKQVHEISLAFDTDLDAPDRCYGWPREAHRFVFPVPQCVKDYRIMGRLGDNWMELVDIRDNYNRRRIHMLTDPVNLDELRVEVLATHGSPSAHIYEIRAY